MILFDEKEDCCGCTACKSICPTKAIEMKADEEGFLYPKINQKLCTNCQVCKRVCPFQNKAFVPDRLFESPAFAAMHKKEQVKMSSASGGAYTAISDFILDSSGLVYGVEFDDEFFVRHNKASCADERDKFRGSKYIQSDLKGIYKQIQEDLNNDRIVLFTGTACQVAGLRNYLCETKTALNKLYTNDIICHGTASPLLWNDYLDFIQKESKLKSYTFRYKGRGWRGYNVRAEFENGKIKINTTDIRVYVNLFSSVLALRPSCYNCKFANLQRPSDITIGDCWGIEKILPEIDDNKGISLVIINTRKGKYLFEKIKKDLDIYKINVADCLQLNLQQPTRKPSKREQFWHDYYKFGFKYIARKYLGYSFKSSSKRLIKRFLHKVKLLDHAIKLQDYLRQIIQGFE